MPLSTSDRMTSRERVRATVQGLPVDRVPVMTWLNPHAACRMMAEFHPATDQVRNGACRSAWEDFSKKRGSLPEDLRAFMPLLYSGFANREYALDIGSDLAALGIPRATVDLDFIASGERADQIGRVMQDLGYRELHRTKDAANYAAQVPLLGLVHFLFSRLRYSREMLARARTRTLASVVEVKLL